MTYHGIRLRFKDAYNKYNNVIGHGIYSADAQGASSFITYSISPWKFCQQMSTSNI